MSSVRRLVKTDRWWRLETAHNGRSVGVLGDAVVVTPGSAAAGLWVGRDRSGKQLVGWLPLHDQPPPASTLLELPATISEGLSPGAAAMMLPASAVLMALRGLEPHGRTGVVGDGPIAAVVEATLAQAAVAPEVWSRESAGLDLLVDASGSPARWNDALSAVVSEGTVLLLVPPWAEPTDVDLLPHLHRRSLRLVAYRWHRVNQTDEEVLRAAQRPAAAGARRLQALELPSPSAESTDWYLFEWPGR